MEQTNQPAQDPAPGLTWTNEKRLLSQLIPWPRNPRRIKVKAGERLQESLKEFGQVEPIIVGPDNDLYNGHQRLRTWAAKYGDIEVDVRVASRPLTETEREKLTIFLHAGATGGWAWDDLTGWNTGDLTEWGFDHDFAHTVNEDSASIRELLAVTYSFEPTVDPEIGAVNVSEQDMERAKQQMDSRYSSAPPEYLDLTCPHCGQQYYIRKDELTKKAE